MELLSRLTLGIVSNPWFGLLSFMFGAVGVIGVIYTIKGLKVMKPRYGIKSNNIIMNFATKLTKLNILYDDEKISNLTVTKFVFWNDGKETIRDNDIATSDPFAIVAIEDVKILEGEIIFENNKANKFDVEILEEGKKLAINFEYVDKNEGVVIQIVHTGKNSQGIRVDGTIKGIGKICECKANNHSNSNPVVRVASKLVDKIMGIRNVKKLGWVVIIFTLLFCTALITLSINADLKTQDRAGTIISCLIFISLILSLYGSLVKRRLPRGFESFENIL